MNTFRKQWPIGDVVNGKMNLQKLNGTLNQSMSQILTQHLGDLMEV